MFAGHFLGNSELQVTVQLSLVLFLCEMHDEADV